MKHLSYAVALLLSAFAAFPQEAADTRIIQTIRQRLLSPSVADHECTFRPAGCNTTIFDETDAYTCRTDNGLYYNTHEIYLNAGTTFTAAAHPTRFSPLIVLFDPDVNVLVSNVAGYGQRTSITWQITRNGFYVIAVSARETAATGPYSLTTSCSTAPPPPPPPPPPACTGGCTANTTTACLLDNRFKVTVNWYDQFISTAGVGHPVRFTENRPETNPQHGTIMDTAFFSFFDFFPNTAEMMVKMTKGVGINNKYWVFVAGLTGAEYTVTVQDTRTCQTWQKRQPAGSTTVIRDQDAFPFP